MHRGNDDDDNGGGGGVCVNVSTSVVGHGGLVRVTLLLEGHVP